MDLDSSFVGVLKKRVLGIDVEMIHQPLCVLCLFVALLPDCHDCFRHSGKVLFQITLVQQVAVVEDVRNASDSFFPNRLLYPEP